MNKEKIQDIKKWWYFWYVLLIKFKTESFIKKQIYTMIDRLNIQDIIKNIIIPKNKKCDDKSKWKSRPGYILIKIQSQYDVELKWYIIPYVVWSMINQIKFVNFLNISKVIKPLTQKEADNMIFTSSYKKDNVLLKHLNKNKLLDIWRLVIKKLIWLGDVIYISKEPFIGCQATILNIDLNLEEFTVRINIFKNHHIKKKISFLDINLKHFNFDTTI